MISKCVKRWRTFSLVSLALEGIDLILGLRRRRRRLHPLHRLQPRRPRLTSHSLGHFALLLPRLLREDEVASRDPTYTFIYMLK